MSAFLLNPLRVVSPYSLQCLPCEFSLENCFPPCHQAFLYPSQPGTPRAGKSMSIDLSQYQSQAEPGRAKSEGVATICLLDQLDYPFTSLTDPGEDCTTALRERERGRRPRPLKTYSPAVLMAQLAPLLSANAPAVAIGLLQQLSCVYLIPGFPRQCPQGSLSCYVVTQA